MIKVISSSQFKVMPWKNGGGTTCEIYRLPHPATPDQFLLRVSRASVHQSGPFSLFPGIDRFLMLLSGNGFVLNKKISLTKILDSHFFPGEENIHCELIQGSCTDFNVMIDRSWAHFTINQWSLKKNEQRLFKGTYLYLEKSDPEFMILNGEVLDYQANEDTIAVEITIQPID